MLREPAVATRPASGPQDHPEALGPDPVSGPRRALIVDEDPTARTFLQREVSEAGYSVEVVGDAEQGIAL